MSTTAQRDRKNEIRKGQKYMIRSKVMNYTDPELRSIGYGKNPEYEGEDVCYFRYDEMSNSYDLGLTKDSRDFVGMSENEILKALEERQYVKECVMLTYGVNAINERSEALSPLSGKRLGMKHGKVVNTNIPEDTALLWGLLLSKKVCFEEDQNKPQYKNQAMYIVESLDELSTLQEEQDKVTADLTEWLVSLLTVDLEKAVLFMREVNVTVNAKMKKATLIRLASEMIRNTKDRDALYTMYKVRDDKYEELVIKDKIRHWIVNGVVREKNSVFYYGELKLGNDVNDVVEYLLRNSELYNELITL
jgi:hypothetical protein